MIAFVVVRAASSNYLRNNDILYNVNWLWKLKLIHLRWMNEYCSMEDKLDARSAVEQSTLNLLYIQWIMVDVSSKLVFYKLS